MKKTIIALLIMFALAVSLFKQLANNSPLSRLPHIPPNANVETAEAQELYTVYLPYVEYTDPITTVEVIIRNVNTVHQYDTNFYDAYHNTHKYWVWPNKAFHASTTPWLNDRGEDIPENWQYHIARSFFEVTIPNDLPAGKVTSAVLSLPLCEGYPYVNWYLDPPVVYTPYPYTYTLDLVNVPGSITTLEEFHNVQVTDTGIGQIEIKPPTALISGTMDQKIGHCVGWDATNYQNPQPDTARYYWDTLIALDINRLASKIQPGASLQFMLRDPNDNRDMRPYIPKPSLIPGADVSLDTSIFASGSNQLGDYIYDRPLVTPKPVVLYVKLLLTIDTSQTP